MTARERALEEALRNSEARRDAAERYATQWAEALLKRYPMQWAWDPSAPDVMLSNVIHSEVDKALGFSRALLAQKPETGAGTRCRHSHIGRCVICGCESEMCCGPSGSISAPAPQQETKPCPSCATYPMKCVSGACECPCHGDPPSRPEPDAKEK